MVGDFFVQTDIYGIIKDVSVEEIKKSSIKMFQTGEKVQAVDELGRSRTIASPSNLSDGVKSLTFNREKRKYGNRLTTRLILSVSLFQIYIFIVFNCTGIDCPDHSAMCIFYR